MTDKHCLNLGFSAALEKKIAEGPNVEGIGVGAGRRALSPKELLDAQIRGTDAIIEKYRREQAELYPWRQ